MLSELGFQPIRDSFYYGYYGQFRVVIDKQDGYINATKLCSDGGKNFFHWKETKVSKELIETLIQSNYNLTLDSEETLEPWSVAHYAPVADVMRIVKTFNISDQDKAISGTYCHPLLIPHIACWISPSFALKASSIINFFLIEEWRTKLMASEQAANELLNNLQNTRQTLENIQVDLDDVNDFASKTLLDLDASEEFNANLIDMLNEKNEEISVKQEAVSQLEGVVVEKAKERQVWASTHAFSMVKLNDEKSAHPFYVIRCQNRRMNGAITKLRRKFPQATVVYQHKKVPNAVNLYTRLKDHKSVKHTHNYCTPTCSEDQLLYLLNSLCGSTYPATNTTPLNSSIRHD
jgi:KilA-N domain/Protein of unknown function (DUF3627)